MATSFDGIRWKRNGSQWQWSDLGTTWHTVSSPGKVILNWRAGPDTTIVISTLDSFWLASPQGLQAFSSPIAGSSISQTEFAGKSLYLLTGQTLWKDPASEFPQQIREYILGIDTYADSLLAWTADSLLFLSSGQSIPLPIQGRLVTCAWKQGSAILLGTLDDGVWIMQNGWTQFRADSGLAESWVHDIACSHDGVCWVLGSYSLTRVSGFPDLNATVINDVIPFKRKMSATFRFDLLGRLTR